MYVCVMLVPFPHHPPCLPFKQSWEQYYNNVVK